MQRSGAARLRKWAVHNSENRYVSNLFGRLLEQGRSQEHPGLCLLSATSLLSWSDLPFVSQGLFHPAPPSDVTSSHSDRPRIGATTSSNGHPVEEGARGPPLPTSPQCSNSREQHRPDDITSRVNLRHIATTFINPRRPHTTKTHICHRQIHSSTLQWYERALGRSPTPMTPESLPCHPMKTTLRTRSSTRSRASR